VPAGGIWRATVAWKGRKAYVIARALSLFLYLHVALWKRLEAHVIVLSRSLAFSLALARSLPPSLPLSHSLPPSLPPSHTHAGREDSKSYRVLLDRPH
jgi:hypothetical protein